MSQRINLNARNRIFAALGTDAQTEAARHADAAGLLANLGQIRPPIDSSDLTAAFIRAATASGRVTSVTTIASLSELPGVVRRYIAANDLQDVIVLQPWPELLALDWQIPTTTSIEPDSLIAVSIARAGIAETGSLVLSSGHHEPMLFNFLPLHHIVVLDAQTLCAHLEDTAATIAANLDNPHAITLISGASGTTDIEGVYVHGAHGPGYLHIALIRAT
ncbi:LutC/YkgG family protein [Acidiphilium sp.]|uniref:LutC/YkgG family protein n=1 Tax=Acidiphilium sp. TaxID=527 RepID=UPI003CFCC883